MSKNYEWESIDEQLFFESGEKELVQVSRVKEYWLEMCAQNKRVLKYLNEKYPDRIFKTQDNQHDFGQYQEIVERIEYDNEEEYDND